MTYCASHLSLAVLEVFVHVDPDDAPSDYEAIEIDIPHDIARETLTPRALPEDWRDIPGPDALKDLGTGWVESARSAVLLVPSAIVPNEHNILLNMAHVDARRILVVSQEPYTFDPRLRK